MCAVHMGSATALKGLIVDATQTCVSYVPFIAAMMQRLDTYVCSAYGLCHCIEGFDW
jgi:hypothetical protein